MKNQVDSSRLLQNKLQEKKDEHTRVYEELKDTCEELELKLVVQ